MFQDKNWGQGDAHGVKKGSNVNFAKIVIKLTEFEAGLPYGYPFDKYKSALNLLVVPVGVVGTRKSRV